MEKSKLKKTKTLVFRTCKIFNFEGSVVTDSGARKVL